MNVIWHSARIYSDRATIVLNKLYLQDRSAQPKIFHRISPMVDDPPFPIQKVTSARKEHDEGFFFKEESCLMSSLFFRTLLNVKISGVLGFIEIVSSR